MISKIKDMMKLTEELEKLNTVLEQNSKSIHSLDQKIISMNDTVSSHSKTIELLSINQKNQNEIFQNTVATINENTSRFKELLNEFSLMKSSLPEKLFEQLDQELKPHLARIKTESKTFDNLNHDLSVITLELGTIQKEISKFKEISASIKKEDFQLVNYKKKLDQEDRNKLSLLKQVDDLKRMIGKERRNRH